MPKQISILLAIGLCLFIAPAPQTAIAQEPELLVEVDRQALYLGDSLTYSVTLNHVANPAPPTLPQLPDFNVESLGQQDDNSQSIIIINGVRTDNIRRGRKFVYRLTPKALGEFKIEAPTATVDGKTLTGRAVSVTVKSQDTVRMQMSLDRSTVYPNQSFTIKLAVLIKSLPDPNSDRDPVSVLSNPPVLRIAWMDDDLISKSLKSDVPLMEMLQKGLSKRGTGFAINGYRDSSPFSILDDRYATFHPRPQVRRIPDGDGDEVEFWEYEFKRTFRAGSVGKLEFAPASVRGVFATSANSRGRLQGEELFASSNSLALEVKDVPSEGRPDSYIGAVGKFSLVSELAPTKAHVGDPLTLTITLTGSGLLSDAQPPRLSTNESITRGFKVYDGTTQTAEDSKRFSYSLRPLDSSVTELPEVEVSYFDVEQEKFVTLKTQRIPLIIAEAERLNSSSIEGASSSPNVDSPAGLQLAEGGLYANDNRLTGLRDERPTLSRFAMLWLAMTSIAACAHLTAAFLRRRHADPRRQRVKTSLARAEQLLASIEGESGGAIEGRKLDQVRAAVVGLIADFVDTPAQGISTSDVEEQLSRLGVEKELRDRIQLLLKTCDAARFGSQQQSISVPDAKSLLGTLHQALRTATNLLFVGIVFMLPGCAPAPDSDVAELFLEAGKEFGSAKSPEQFAGVAARYQQLIDVGFVSGSVLYNQGNAWQKSGQYGRAIACYRQALQFRPRDLHAQANLKTAQAAASGLATKTSTTSGPLGYVYFWRDWFNLREKLAILSVLIAVFFIVSFFLWRSKTAKLAMAGCALLLSIFSAGCWLDYQDQILTKHGVILADGVIAFKGTGADYGPSFTGSLDEGTEFIVTDQQLDWLQIELTGLGHGWIRQDQAVTY